MVDNDGVGKAIFGDIWSVRERTGRGQEGEEHEEKDKNVDEDGTNKKKKSLMCRTWRTSCRGKVDRMKMGKTAIPRGQLSVERRERVVDGRITVVQCDEQELEDNNLMKL